MTARRFTARCGWPGWLLAWLLRCLVGQAQPAAPPAGEAALLPVPTAMAVTGPLKLAFRLRGAPLSSHSAFPELEGFRKAGQASTTTTQLLPGGRRRTELTVEQRYLPYAEGEYVVPPFTLTVNGQVLHSAGGRVRVGPAPPAEAAASTGAAVGSLDQLLGKPKPKYFYEPPDDGSLVLEADHDRVYMGQGVRINLYFYLRPADQALLSFYDFNNQLTELLRQLRQPTTWEVPEPDPAILPDSVRRANGQVYLRFRLAAGTYYPLTPQALQFPALHLTLIKFRLLKKPQPGENERLPMYKTYAAPALRVAVRPLPAPGSTVVGDYALHESISSTRFRTGEAFTYTFGVEGSGNAAALGPPAVHTRPGLEVYGPDVRNAQLPDGRLQKNFRYRLVVQRPGPLALDSLLELAFFNPRTARYDTLRPQLQLVVSGGSRALSAAQPTNDPFYGPALSRADADLQPLNVYRQVGRYATALVAALLAVAVVGWWRAR